MSKSCDVLILTARFGSGHRSAAQALQESLQRENHQLAVEIIDFIDIFLAPFSGFIYRVDYLSSNTFTGLYNNVYYRKQDQGGDVLTGKMVSSYVLRRLHKYVAARSPRIIISTFPLSAYYVSLLKEKCGAEVRAVTCITDMVVQPEWFHPATDLYLTAHPRIRRAMIDRGIAEEKVEASGIPIRSDFWGEAAGKETVHKYGIDDGQFVILLMGGGNGYLPGNPSLYRWLGTLENSRVLVFTANNRRLYRRLSTRDLGQNIQVLSFTDEVAQLMKRADLLISKAGGVTITEALACSLPMIIYQAELGQELENRRFLLENNLGLAADSESELKELIKQLMYDPALYQEIKASLAEYSDQVQPATVGRRILQLIEDGEVV